MPSAMIGRTTQRGIISAREQGKKNFQACLAEPLEKVSVPDDVALRCAASVVNSRPTDWSHTRRLATRTVCDSTVFSLTLATTRSGLSASAMNKDHWNVGNWKANQRDRASKWDIRDVPQPIGKHWATQEGCRFFLQTKRTLSCDAL